MLQGRWKAGGRRSSFSSSRARSLQGRPLPLEAMPSGRALRERKPTHDSQYGEDEYSARVGWGHSSVAQAVSFAQVANGQQLVMFHHDPGHDDALLEVLLSRARELWGHQGEPPVLAHEGMELEIDF